MPPLRRPRHVSPGSSLLGYVAWALLLAHMALVVDGLGTLGPLLAEASVQSGAAALWVLVTAVTNQLVLVAAPVTRGACAKVVGSVPEMAAAAAGAVLASASAVMQSDVALVAAASTACAVGAIATIADIAETEPSERATDDSRANAKRRRSTRAGGAADPGRAVPRSSDWRDGANASPSTKQQERGPIDAPPDYPAEPMAIDVYTAQVGDKVHFFSSQAAAFGGDSIGVVEQAFTEAGRKHKAHIKVRVPLQKKLVVILADPNAASLRAERGVARAQSNGQLVDGRKARAAAAATAAHAPQQSPRGRNQHKRQLDSASAVKSAASAVKRSRNVPTTPVDLIVRVGPTERWKVTVTPGQTPRTSAMWCRLARQPGRSTATALTQRASTAQRTGAVHCSHACATCKSTRTAPAAVTTWI